MQSRIDRLVKTVNYEKADRIPLVAWRSDYMINYFGLEQRDMDFENIVDVYVRGNEVFDWDACDLSAPFNPTYGERAKIFQGSMYHMNDDHNAVQIDPSAIEPMAPEEYEDFTKDPPRYLANVLLPRRLKVFDENHTKEEKLAALRALDEINAKNAVFRNSVVDKTGLVGTAHVMVSVPIDFIFDFLRNMTGIAKDMRRCPEKIIEASDVLVQHTLNDIKNAPVIPHSAVTSALHLTPFLKPKDFERFYWPYFEDIIVTSHNCGHKCKMLFEKSWKHVFNYLDELPANSLIGYMEREDGFGYCVEHFAPKKQIIVGGIESELLARGTKQQVIDQVKFNIENYCGDGGVMLAPDLPLIYKVDAIPENYKAAMDTVRKYGNY